VKRKQCINYLSSNATILLFEVCKF